MNNPRTFLGQLSDALTSSNPAMLVSCGLGLLILSAFTEFVAQNLLVSSAMEIRNAMVGGGPPVFWPTLTAFVARSLMYAGIIVAATGAVRIFADAIAARDRANTSVSHKPDRPYDPFR
ncbi:MAG: hypothetical protein SFY96_04530 [Planctomycetota bacterium]|nr:hypothetical protein [Planctomycetota bacterium]